MGFWLGAAVPVALVRKAYLTVIHTTGASSSTNPSSPPARSAGASMCFRPTFLARLQCWRYTRRDSGVYSVEKTLP
ncbi:hypothetical protein C8F04DRAFT_1118018, partial [Mycena alexandri]